MKLRELLESLLEQAREENNSHPDADEPAADPDSEPGLDDSAADLDNDYYEEDYSEGGYEIIEDDEYPGGATGMSSGYARFDNFLLKELTRCEDAAEITFKVTITNQTDEEEIQVVLHGLDDEGFEVCRETVYKRVPPGSSRDITAKILVTDIDGYNRVKRWLCDDEY